MLRCEEPGYICVTMGDHRRGLWYRIADAGIEVCAGREGDDDHVKLRVGELVTAQQIAELAGCLESVVWARDMSSATLLIRENLRLRNLVVELEARIAQEALR